MAKQQKYLREKFGGVENEMHEDEEEEEEQKAVWGGKKDLYYDGDNVDFEVRICIQGATCLILFRVFCLPFSRICL